MPLQAQDKLAFLLSLVAYLIDRDRVSVEETAQHFGVPAAQVREAVRLIAVSGVPGDSATYQHNDLFDISWDDLEERDEIVLTNRVAIDDSPRFSAREASALIAGLQYLSTLPEYGEHGAVHTLIAKLARGASAEPGPLAVGETETDATLAMLRESVERGVQIEFDYRNARGEAERRRVDPLRVESLDADWFVRGWCHLREATRIFRIDRITNPLITSEPITRRARDVVLPDALFENSGADSLVTIDVAPSALPLLADYIPEGATTEDLGDRVRTVLRVAHFHGLKRLIASMPGVATVVAPPEARAAVAEWAAAGAARYGA